MVMATAAERPVTKVEFSIFNVLVIEDSPFMLELFRAVLRAFDFGEVNLFSNAEEAYEYWKRNQVDCLITDWVMRPTNGIEICRNVRHQVWDVNRKTPIIMCSAHTDLKHIRTALEAGVNEVLTKPITPASIYEKLYAALYVPRRFIVSDDYVGPEIRAKFWKDTVRDVEKEQQKKARPKADNSSNGTADESGDEFLV